MEIDRVMKPYEESRQRQERRARALAERPGDIPERPEGWQDRARALMADFHKGDGPTEEEQIAAIRAKYSEEDLAKVPDRKDYDGWRSPPFVPIQPKEGNHGHTEGNQTGNADEA